MVRQLKRRHGKFWTALALALGMVLAGCGGGDNVSGGGDASGGNVSGGASGDATGPPDGSTSPAAASSGVPAKTGFIGITETEADPRQGGTLTLGVWAEARGLDPSIQPSAGVLGGMELAAIYSVLVRYDPATGEYEPWLAQSLEHSDDYATWTLGLREGVRFSDGTPLNAAAVVANVERTKEGPYGEPLAPVESMETPNEHTVVFHLSEPWSRFPFVLSVGAGRVPSPTAVQKWGEDYGKHPVGAGPFVLDHFSPGEEMVLTANENYWGEGPYLDKLRFVPLGGDQARLDSLKAGGIQTAFLRDAKVIADTRAAGYGGFVNVVSSGEVLAINNSEGHPGADVRVRKAIAHAINPEQFNQRVYDGKGLVQKEMMAGTSRWATEAEATPYDPEKAKELLAEAKADGYDGMLTIATSSSPVRQASALTLQAQLDAVGFETSIENSPSSSALFGKLIKGSYELSFYGVSIYDSAPWATLTLKLTSGASGNYARYANPEMDTLVNDLHDATTEEAKQQVLNEIQQLWTETVPLVPLAAIPNFVALDEDLHGVVPTTKTTLLFSEAWLS